MDELIQPLFGFSYILAGEHDQAKDLMMDAYTVFLVREKRFLQKKDLDSKDKVFRRQIKKHLYHELLREILELAMKRKASVQPTHGLKISEEFKCFFEMGTIERATFYLKEVKGFSIEDIQTIFGFERARVVELYYNARQVMVGDIESLYREGYRAN